jgi:dTDP-D-glucose 4,6-dehydratase
LEQTINWYLERADWVEGVRQAEYRNFYAKYYENRNSALEAVMAAGDDSVAFGMAAEERGPRKDERN